jgi:putative peptidoglycan lipid II flippase
MSRTLSSIFSVSSATLLSRVLGLFRDILVFAALGASLWNSAFLLAFTLPNLLRRLLGEGALTAALIPILSQTRHESGDQGAFRFLNAILLRLTVVLAGIVVLGFILAGLVLGLGEERIGRWSVALELLQVLSPYLILICLAAAFAAALNVWRQFLWPSLSPVWLNLAMIGSLIPYVLGERDPQKLVFYLCLGVLLGGLAQCLVPAVLTYRLGWRPSLNAPATPRLHQFGSLFLPSLMGAAILQINTLISRVLAFTVSPEGVSQLYLAVRLVEFPLGLFAVAVSTVFFPLLAARSASRDSAGFSRTYEEGLLLTLALTIPAAAGLALLGLPMLTLLFSWGAFGNNDAVAVYPILVIYSVGIPFYALAGYLTRNFHARQDMKTPLRVAGYTLLFNLGASLALMPFLGVIGLALANVLASVYQTVWLAYKESRRAERSPLRRWRLASLQIALALLPMAALCLPGFFWRADFAEFPKILNAALMLSIIGAAAVVYFLTLVFLRFPGLRRLARFLPRKFRHV